MRSLFTPVIFLVCTGASAQVIVNTNFDGVAAGARVAQSLGAPWTTWTGMPGSAEDAVISTEQAYSGQNSAKWSSTLSAGGPQDNVVTFGGRTTGRWLIQFQMYIPVGSGGYFNLLHHYQDVSSEWAIEVSFLADGSVSTLLEGLQLSRGRYPSATWFPVEVLVDLNDDSAVLSVNGVDLATWPFSQRAVDTTPGMLRLDAINFYAYAGGADLATYYIDDLVVQNATGLGMSELPVALLSLYPNPSSDHIRIEHAEHFAHAQWTVRDATGRAVRAGRLANATSTELSVAELRSGAYLLQIERPGQQREVLRFVRQ